MTTDDERREVARKLRFNAGTAPYMNTPDDFAREVFRAAMDESIVDYRAAIKRLADLIDPGDAAEAVDRDALLALADEFDEEAEAARRLVQEKDSESGAYAYCASCIRKRLRVKS